jgi:hypothetical protein
MHQNTKTQGGTQKMQKLMHFLVSPHFFFPLYRPHPDFLVAPRALPKHKVLA